MKAYDDILGVLAWLALGLAYGSSVWKLSRPDRDVPSPAPSSARSNVAALRARRGDRAEPGAASDADRGVGRRPAA